MEVLVLSHVCLTLFDFMDCSSSVPGDSPGKNTGVGSHPLLQGIFPTQGSNPDLLHCRQILYCLATREAPKPFSYMWYRYFHPHPLIVAYFFTLSVVFFDEQKFLIFIQSSFPCFSVVCAFCLLFKKSFYTCEFRYSHIILPWSVLVLSFTLWPFPPWNPFYIEYEVAVLFFPFHMDFHLCPHYCITKIFVISQVPICE